VKLNTNLHLQPTVPLHICYCTVIHGNNSITATTTTTTTTTTNNNNNKGKVHPRTVHEDPEAEQMYS